MHPKKKLGIIGGMGSHATVWLFKRIIELCNASSDQEYLDVLVHNNSNIPDRTSAILHGGPSSLPELMKSLNVLSAYNVDVVTLACMTAYYYSGDLQENYKGKILNPIDLIKQQLLQNPLYAGKKRLGIIGSSGLLQSGLFQKVFSHSEYEVLIPGEEHQKKYFMEILYGPNGVKAGKLNASHREAFYALVELLVGQGAEVVIGACSEIPLLNDNNIPVPFIDAFELLATETVRYCYNKPGYIA